MKNILIVISLMAASLAGAQAPKKQTVLKSYEGTLMQLKMETNTWKSGQDAGGGTAYNFNLELSSADLKSTSKVRAILTDTCTWSVARQSFQQGLQADLEPKKAVDGSLLFGADFSGNLPTHYAMHGGDSYTCLAQLSVVIDGVWQTDPVNQTHNFNFNFY